MTLIKKHDATGDAPREFRHQSRDRAGLLCQLEADAPEQRRWAALDLAAFSDAADALCDRLEQETQTPVREAILTSLIQIGGNPVVCGLMPLLRSEDAALRNQVIEALQQLPEAVSPYIERMLADDDADYRIFAINVLANLRHPQAPAWLQDVIERDDNINACAAAVDGLAEIGTPEAIPALTALPERFADDPFMQFCTQTAIRRIQGHGA
ncbi:MAG: hypothetical protein QG599_155 [Pseudomonadota bacterium]|nr:hypothetical protein [Pseudomonadota bacterium]